MRITPLSELNMRYKALQKLLQQQDIAGAILLQNSDLFYFTGSIQRGLLYVPAEGEPVYLVIKDYNRACLESSLCQIQNISSIRELPAQLQKMGLRLPQRIGMELDVLPVLQFQRYQKLFPAAEIADVSPLIRKVRAIKSEYELGIMQKSALIAEKTYEQVKNVVAVGITDLEVAAELECFARKEGHQGIIRFRSFNSELYFGHVFSGSDGAEPAYLDAPLGGLGLNSAVGQGSGYKTIKAGEPIIIDFIVAYDGYLVDQTRSLSIGPLTDSLQQAYADMLKVQEKLVTIARPGIVWGDIYQQCCGLAVDLGYKDNFMGAVGAQVSFIGHGIGIEVDEYPFIAKGFDEQVLEKNMTFAFEPKAVFPGVGAVGIENTWRVTVDGIERITFASENLLQL
ncbi:MAG: Xaa-Pro peptidase family protein [Desulfuromusa sp.]|jgi:Xaa-Pro dipeptidase|nr:Xaa-Pro peptidase family protein [Desulfuromusa sp.]